MSLWFFFLNFRSSRNLSRSSYIRESFWHFLRWDWSWWSDDDDLSLKSVCAKSVLVQSTPSFTGYTLRISVRISVYTVLFFTCLYFTWNLTTALTWFYGVQALTLMGSVLWTPNASASWLWRPATELSSLLIIKMNKKKKIENDYNEIFA